MKSVVHIYGQQNWHDAAVILGDREGLEKLRAAVDAALAGDIGHAEVFVNDGEGYPLLVGMVEKTADSLAVPYTDECAQELDVCAINPEDLIDFKDGFRWKGER